MSMEFENILETAMNFIKDVGELTENAKESFDSLKDMKKVFQDVQENQLEDPIIEDASGGYAIGRLTNTEGLLTANLRTARGTLRGVIYATEQIKVIIGKYEEHKTVINGLQADLDCLVPKIREKARKVDDMAETMIYLNV